MKRAKRKVSKCTQEIQGVLCTGKYILDFEGNIPIFTCDTCGHQNITWKKFYEEYLQLYKVRENWNDSKNSVSCILGIFCHYYKEFYMTDYTFVPKNPNPYGIKECKDAWTLLGLFNKDIHEVRKYIVWLFTKGLNKGTTITNFGYILAPGLVQKYKLYVRKKHILTRASKLPDQLVDHCKIYYPDIFNNFAFSTMNDLGALLKYVEFYNKVDGYEAGALSVAKQMGLIKDGKLNIGDDK